MRRTRSSNGPTPLRVDETLIVVGPVQETHRAGALQITLVSPMQPNPMSSRGVFFYVVGTDIISSGGTRVSLTVYDTRDRRVRTLVDEMQGVGEYRVEWDGCDNAGRIGAAGTYYSKFRAGVVERQSAIVVMRRSS